MSNRHYRTGYADGRASAAADTITLIQSEIDLYTKYMPEQQGKIEALNFILPFVERLAGTEVSR